MDTQTFFYIAGGGLCVVALALSLKGIRDQDFPRSGRSLFAGLAVVFLIVATASTGAVLAARHEQKLRREEFSLLAQEEAAQEGAEDAAPVEEGGAAEPPAEAPAEEPPAPAEAPPAPETADIDAAALFESNGCGGCHTLAAAGATATVGPDLDEVLPGQTAEQISESIVDPSAEITDGFGDGIMPASFGTAMTEAEIAALVDYLLESAG